MYMANSEDKLRMIDPNAKDGGRKFDESNEIIDSKVSASYILQ